MNPWTQHWVYLANTPLFGLAATLLAYTLGVALYARLDYKAWANPMLWSVLALCALLLATHTPYERYFEGAQFIHFLLGPAVVAMAWPLWLRRAMLRRHARALFAAALAGGAVAAASAVLLGWALGLPREVLLSIAPKALTAPVAMGVAQIIGGVAALSAVFALFTGLVGAVLGQYLFALLRVRQWPVRGFALGTQSHGFGTARALQENAEAGAYAALALGLQALLGAALIPLAVRVLS